MRFISKTEAYTYSLSILTYIRNKSLDIKTSLKAPSQRINAINDTIEDTKVALENHEQNPKIIVTLLEQLKPLLNQEDQQCITTLQNDIQQSDYQQTPQAKYENILARRFESEMAIALLQNPTHATMNAVKRVSDQLQILIRNNSDAMSLLIKQLTQVREPITFGEPDHIPTSNDLLILLEENSPTKLIEIMYLHYLTANKLTRAVSIKHLNPTPPVGKLAETITDIYSSDTPLDFFKIALASPLDFGVYSRSYISDQLFYKSPLFTAAGNRGRLGSLDNFQLHVTNQLGLMLQQQQDYEIGLPTHSSTWCPDCKCQPANLKSAYVIDLIDNDAVYVAGPSGMTSILLNQMEILANFEDENLKKNYLSAIVAYVVGGGFHSIHEVIGPAQYSLNLVPGYYIQAPEPGKLALPPNYHHFFRQQAAIDPDFNDRYEKAWQNYLTFFNENYLPRHQPQLPLMQAEIEIEERLLYPGVHEDKKSTTTTTTAHHERFFKPETVNMELTKLEKLQIVEWEEPKFDAL